MSDTKDNNTQSTKSAEEHSISEKSRFTLAGLTGDETDEECEQIAEQMLEALNLPKT
jgi:hypothetical protein